MTRPFVSVIVPAYNDGARLERCLSALDAQEYPRDRYEVIVVDNASTEDVRSVAVRHGARCLLETRRGPAAARNRGIRESRAEVIAFTDADCLPCPGWIASGVSALEADPSAGLVAGRVRLVPRDPARPTGIELHNMATYLDQRAHALKQHYAATASAFTRARVLDKVGLFDERYTGAAFEDRDLGERVHAAGYRVLYSEEASVDHPARSGWREYYAKVRLIRRGERIYRATRGLPQEPLLGDLMRFLKLPHRRLRALLLGPAHPAKGIGQKLSVIPVILFAHYAGAWARLRSRSEKGRSV